MSQPMVTGMSSTELSRMSCCSQTELSQDTESCWGHWTDLMRDSYLMVDELGMKTCHYFGNQSTDFVLQQNSCLGVQKNTETGGYHVA